MFTHFFPNLHTKRRLDTCLSEETKTSYILKQREYLFFQKGEYTLASASIDSCSHLLYSIYSCHFPCFASSSRPCSHIQSQLCLNRMHLSKIPSWYPDLVLMYGGINYSVLLGSGICACEPATTMTPIKATHSEQPDQVLCLCYYGDAALFQKLGESYQFGIELIRLFSTASVAAAWDLATDVRTTKTQGQTNMAYRMRNMTPGQ